MLVCKELNSSRVFQALSHEVTSANWRRSKSVAT